MASHSLLEGESEAKQQADGGNNNEFAFESFDGNEDGDDMAPLFVDADEENGLGAPALIQPRDPLHEATENPPPVSSKPIGYSYSQLANVETHDTLQPNFGGDGYISNAPSLSERLSYGGFGVGGVGGAIPNFGRIINPVSGANTKKGGFGGADNSLLDTTNPGLFQMGTGGLDVAGILNATAQLDALREQVHSASGAGARSFGGGTYSMGRNYSTGGKGSQQSEYGSLAGSQLSQYSVLSYFSQLSQGNESMNQLLQPPMDYNLGDVPQYEPQAVASVAGTLIHHPSNNYLFNEGVHYSNTANTVPHQMKHRMPPPPFVSHRLPGSLGDCAVEPAATPAASAVVDQEPRQPSKGSGGKGSGGKGSATTKVKKSVRSHSRIHSTCFVCQEKVVTCGETVNTCHVCRAAETDAGVLGVRSVTLCPACVQNANIRSTLHEAICDIPQAVNTSVFNLMPNGVLKIYACQRVNGCWNKIRRFKKLVALRTAPEKRKKRKAGGDGDGSAQTAPGQGPDSKRRAVDDDGGDGDDGEDEP